MFLLKYCYNENTTASLSCFNVLSPDPTNSLLPNPSQPPICFLAAEIIPEK